MDWKTFQRLKVKDVPVWGLDLLLIPLAIIAGEWLWFVQGRPILAIGAGIAVVALRQLIRHFYPPKPRH